jgi:lipoprotein-anchoring transpeptidase ErfK/SrfK
MRRILLSTLFTIFAATSASAGPLAIAPENAPTPAAASAPFSLADLFRARPAETPAPAPRYAAAQGPNFGGGFLEMLFGGGMRQPEQPYESAPQPSVPQYDYGYGAPQGGYAYGAPQGDPAHPAMDPRFMRQEVNFASGEKPGTIIINTKQRMLYLIEGDGHAMRYGIGVGRPGFAWAGVHHITNKREWPDWTPPAEMLKRRPDLPRHMAGGPENPLGARAMYLGSTLYRIHGSNEPWTIGHAVSSGCIRLRNQDVIDLYNRVKVGAKVVVL